MTPFPSPRYLPCAGFLFNFKLTVFLIFSVLLSRRLGKRGGRKSIQRGRRSRSLWITRHGPRAGGVLCSLEQGTMGVTFRDQGQVTGSGQEHERRSKVFTVYARNWEISSMRHQGSLISSVFLFFLPSCILMASSLLSHLTALLTPLQWYTGPEPVIMPTLQIWVWNISTAGSVIIR